MSASDASDDDSPLAAEAPTAIAEIMGELFVITLKDCRGRGGAVIDPARARTVRFVLQHSLARALGVKPTGSSFPSMLDRWNLGQTVLSLNSAHSVGAGLITQPNLNVVLGALFGSMKREDALCIIKPRKAAMVPFTSAVQCAKNMRSRAVLEMLNEPIPQAWINEAQRARELEEEPDVRTVCFAESKSEEVQLSN